MTYGSLRLGEVSKGANVDRKEVHGQGRHTAMWRAGISRRLRRRSWAN